MKRYFVFFAFQLLVCMLNAQTYTFYMHEMNNTKYEISIDLKENKITATKSGREVFSEDFFYYTIDRQQKRIGISVDWWDDAVTEPLGSSFFIISRGKGIAARLEDGTEYRLKCDNSISHASTYDQLAKTLFPPPSPPPPPPSNNDYRTFTVNGVSFHMVLVQGGTFTMGDAYGQEGDDDYPAHIVTISGYMIGQTEVTQSLWQAVMGSNPSYFNGNSKRPVENVSWDDCQDFIRKLNSLTGEHFRLPTEAEWEYAARGGRKSKGNKYSGGNNIGDVAWYDDNSGSTTHPVATKSPNELGIYDMSGNVMEWCQDLSYFGNGFYSILAYPTTLRALRGGSWDDGARECPVYTSGGTYPYRPYRDKTFGLRLALNLNNPPPPPPPLSNSDYQTYTFSMRHYDTGASYNVSIDVSRKQIIAQTNNTNEFSCYFYNHKISDNVIGLSLTNSNSVPMTPDASSYFLLTHGGAIIVKLTNGKEYPLVPANTSDFQSKYGELARALNVSSGSNLTFTANGVSFTMVYVQGGTFTMGATGGFAMGNEEPHRVTLSNYYIGQTEVTQSLWKAVMGSNPSYFKGNSQRPVENVFWNDCQEFIRKLNSLTGQHFRLPTEAEWEYAARGGNKSLGYEYSGSNDEDNVAWYRDFYGEDIGEGSPNYGTHPVATKSPNELGIYDMTGNVWEWCQDWYGEKYYSNSPQNNPQGPSSGTYRVLRGGSWNSFGSFCGVHLRNQDFPDSRSEDFGFRLAF